MTSFEKAARSLKHNISLKLGSQRASSEITSQQTSRISVTENFLLRDLSGFSDR